MPKEKESIRPTEGAAAGKSPDEVLAEETERAEAAGESAPKEIAMKDNEFSLADLKEHSSTIFGVPGHVIVGALHGQEEKDVYAKAEIQRAVDKFLAQEVS